MLSNMINKMSDEELEKTLTQAKSLLSPQDYKALEEIINKKKNRGD